MFVIRVNGCCDVKLFILPTGIGCLFYDRRLGIEKSVWYNGLNELLVQVLILEESKVLHYMQLTRSMKMVMYIKTNFLFLNC